MVTTTPSFFVVYVQHCPFTLPLDFEGDGLASKSLNEDLHRDTIWRRKRMRMCNCNEVCVNPSFSSIHPSTNPTHPWWSIRIVMNPSCLDTHKPGWMNRRPNMSSCLPLTRIGGRGKKIKKFGALYFRENSGLTYLNPVIRRMLKVWSCVDTKRIRLVEDTKMTSLSMLFLFFSTLTISRNSNGLWVIVSVREWLLEKGLMSLSIKLNFVCGIYYIMLAYVRARQCFMELMNAY